MKVEVVESFPARCPVPDALPARGASRPEAARPQAATPAALSQEPSFVNLRGVRWAPASQDSLGLTAAKQLPSQVLVSLSQAPLTDTSRGSWTDTPQHQGERLSPTSILVFS